MCLPCQTCYELHDVSTFQNKHKNLKSCDQDSKQFPHNELTSNLTSLLWGVRIMQGGVTDRMGAV